MSTGDDLNIVLQYLVEGILLVWGGDTPPSVQAPDRNYGYGLYQLGLDMLSGHLACHGRTIPTTWFEWAQLFATPMADWWPGPLPSAADSEIPLLLDSRPSEWLADYLICSSKGRARKAQASLWYYHAELQQAEILALMNWCREHQPAAYPAVRAYLIRNPVTTEVQLRQFCFNQATTMQMPQDLLFGFYENIPDTCLHDEQYWRCPYCGGLLRWFWDRPRCVRHSVCVRLSNNYQDCEVIPKAQAALRLKTGIHWRVCVPGIPELQLYEQLVQLQEQGQLRAVDLWPGVDQYDLRIVFNTGEIWAIDIKDIANPVHLRSQLQQEQQFVNVGDLCWDKAFFVVPQYRCEWSRDYVHRATPEGFWAKVQDMRTFRKALKSILK